MPTRHAVTLLGGPESGKTTYLGALVRALREEPEGSRLRLSALQEDESTIQRLMDPLFEGAYPQRTKHDQTHAFEIALETVQEAEDVQFTLQAGDYAGELVERLFRRHNVFSREWHTRAGSDGLLLFVRHDALTPLPRALRTAPTEQERFEALKSRRPDGTTAPPKSTGKRPQDVFGPGVHMDPLEAVPTGPRDPVKVPTTLALIEVLQFLRHVRGLSPGERPPLGSLRVAVLISAWDGVKDAFRTRGPTRYLVEELPLLHDFLWSNFREDDICAFGLSATGGDLRDEAHQARYLDDPAGFVEWSNSATQAPVRTPDLSIPVRWALFGERVLMEPR